jgi:hypothetical protein
MKRKFENDEKKEVPRKLVRVNYEECDRPRIPYQTAVETANYRDNMQYGGGIFLTLNRTLLVHYLQTEKESGELYVVLADEFRSASAIEKIDRYWDEDALSDDAITLKYGPLQLALCNGRNPDIIHHLLCNKEMNPNILPTTSEETCLDLVNAVYDNDVQKKFVALQLKWFGARTEINEELVDLHKDWKLLPWALHLITGLSTDISLIIDSFRCQKCPFG